MRRTGIDSLHASHLYSLSVQLNADGRVTYRNAFLSPGERREKRRNMEHGNEMLFLVPLSPSGREGLGE
jgi:hypothetical protein